MADSSSSIPSAQRLDNDQPRFQIPAAPDDPAWDAAASEESEGGVAAEIRVFLDAQLAGGDVVLDISPGFGFVALSATTAPSGMPSVLVCGLDADRFQQLLDAAVDVGGWLDELPAIEDAAELVEARLESGGRVFVHVESALVPRALQALSPVLPQERVLAVCVSDADSSPVWGTAQAALAAAGFVPCALAEQHGDAVILPIDGMPTGPVIALPRAVIGPADEPKNASASDAGTHPSTHVDGPGGIRGSTWSPVEDGLVLSSSHSRVGYGVAGANLLDALQRRGAKVSFRPLDRVDRSLTTNPHLDAALALAPSDRMPSVLLNQQFLLMDHVGTGPRVGFTIFERDVFSADELRKMQAQSALLVCTEWAREVCLANGITVPIHLVPLGVDRAIFHEQLSASRRDGDTVFMQVGKLEVRKGQLELLHAFESAFTPADPVQLVVHCRNPFLSKTAFDELAAPFRASPMRRRITVMDSELATARDVAALMATADCGVFPSRAEGWNLEALEMLSMGKPVIATNVTAHTGFLSAANARLIDIDAMEPAMGGALEGSWAAWGSLQHEQLVAHLSAVHAQRQAEGLPQNAAGIATARHFTWDASAEALVAALQAIC